MHTAEERANVSSGEQLAQPGVPEGCPQSPALCLLCWLKAVEEKVPWQAQRCQWADTAQAVPTCHEAEGPCLAAVGEALPVPS